MRKWVVILIVVAIGLFLGYNYLYQDHRDIGKESAEFFVTSNDLSDEFQNDALASERKYLNKTISVSGPITELNASDLLLGNVAFCQFTNPLPDDLSENKTIKVKGRFIGYDELFGHVKLDQCSIIN